MSLVSSTSGGHAHKVVKESADLPGVLKRKIYRDGGGKNKHLLQAKYEDLQQELLSTKQAIVRHVIQSRAIEQSKNDLVLIQQSLHRTILEKNDPDLLKYLEIRKLATFYAFNNQYPNYALHRIDQSMSWKYSGLVQYLIEKLSKYSNQEFKQALESNTIEDISLDLYTQIVSNATHFMISMKDIESMFNLGKEMYEASVTMNSPSNTTLWEVLKRKLYRKLLHLYILQQAVLYITDAEKKLQYKEHFQFKIDKSDRPKSQQSQNPNNASILDSQRIFTSSSIDPFHQNDNKSLLSASLSSLELKKPSTASSSINHGKKNKKHPQQPSVLLPKLQLEKELEKSRQQQFYLKEQIVQNFHEIVLQDSQLRKQQQTPSISSSMTSLSSSHGNSSLPIISPRYNSRPIATPAIKQYYYNIGLNKLFLFLQDRYLKKLYQKKFLTWQKYLIQCQNEKNVINFCKQASYYRFFRVFQYNIVRRIYTRFSTWSKYCKYYKQREQLSAVITMQRFWRGYLARKARKQVTAQRAAKCINGIIRIFAAKKLLRYRRIKVLQRKSAKKIESAWYKSRFRLSINQRVLAKRKIRYIQLMQRVYRGYKGRLRAKKRKQFLQMISGATKFQSLFRRYQAVIRVEKMRIRRNRLLASILIQKHIRRKLQAAKFAVVWKRHQKAKIIQYAWYYYKARCVRFEHVKWWKALDIQRVVRGRIGRKRFQHFYDLHQAELKRRAAAVKVIEPIILGYATRRRLKDILNSYLQRRQRAARVIQVRLKAITLGIKARQRVEEMRALGALVLARERGALKIQTQIRRKLATVRVKRLLDKKLIEIQREEMKIPYYFRIKKRYYLSQNTYHYQYVLRIQCLARRFLARRKVERRKEERKNDVFESIRSHSFKSGSSFDSQSIKMMSAQFLLASRSGKLSEKDSQRLKEFRELEVVRSYFAVIVQRYYRGFHIRSNFKRNKAIPALIWFCRETKVRFHIKQFLRNYRLWKLEQIRRHMAVTKIAALARGRQQRKRFKKNYRLLVRQRELRIRAKRLKAAITIQCSYRCVRARRRVIKQRKIVEERDREKRELQELEDSIQGLHERWMHELMAIRAQTGVRGMLARSEFAKRLEAFKKQDQEEKKNKRDKSAIVIQALARGVVSRKKFKKNLPNLKKQQKMKIFCVQCEQQIALKRCRQCRDRFCNECYDIIHQKGNRKNHSWENIKVDARMLAMAYDSGNNANAGNLQASQRVSTFGVATTRNVSMMNTAGGMGARNTIAEPIEPVKKVNPKDWEEFYDESARAKYWYNKKTGEASWINPFK